MDDEDDKAARGPGTAPQAFVPGRGAPDSRRLRVAAPAKPLARSTAPAGTPSNRAAGALGRTNQTPVSDRPPPGAQNTLSAARTVGGRTARLKLPELDEPGEPIAKLEPPARAVLASVPQAPVGLEPPAPRPRGPREGVTTQALIDAIAHAHKVPPFDLPIANDSPIPHDDDHSHRHDHDDDDHDDSYEPRATPTAPAVPGALAAFASKEAERQAALASEDALRASPKSWPRAPKREVPDVLTPPPPPPPLPLPLYADAPAAPTILDSRWPLAVAIGAVSLAIGALLPLPFRKYIAPQRPVVTAMASASAAAPVIAPPVLSAPAVATLATPTPFTGAPAVFPQAPPTPAAPVGATVRPSSAPSRPPGVTAPIRTAPPANTSRGPKTIIDIF